MANLGVETLVETVALGASCLALYFLARLRNTYFLDSRFFIGAANVGFIVILAQQLTADVSGTPPSQTLYVGMLSETALSIGFASYLLGRSQGRSGFRELADFLTRPPTSFIVYTAIVASWTFTALVFQPWELRTVTSEGSWFYYQPAPWYILSGSFLLLAFIAFPVLGLYRQGAHLSDAKAANSMRMISVSWASFGVVALIQAVVGGDIFPVVQGVGTLVDSLLFIMIAFALREPTILSRMISSSESFQAPVHRILNFDTVALYNVESDRRKLVEAFVRQVLATGQDAICFVAKTELPYYAAITGEARSRSAYHKGGRILVQPIENDRSNSASSISVPGFSRSTSELIDLGELDVAQSALVIDRVKALDALPGPRRMRRVWALNVERAQPSLLSMIRGLSPDSRTLDLAGHQDSFAGLVGHIHQDIQGSRILLEYEPSSDYELVVQKFAREFQANVEPVAVFTSLGSPVHRQLRNQHDLRLFSFSTKTSTPIKISDEEVLLPERDSSLLLDAVDKLLQAHHGQRVGLAFDVFTDLILFQGFDKAYGVLSSVVEMTESESTTTLILINYTALEERALNGVRGLFGSQVRYGPEGSEVIRFSDSGKTNKGVSRSREGEAIGEML